MNAPRILAALLALSLAAPAHAAMALNPQVTQANIASTICVARWTTTVRPPVAYTNAVKYQLMDKAGIPRARAHEFELDHLVNLSIGGHPRNRDNLRLQPWDGPDGAKVKDKLEVRLQKLVCAHKLPLATAQACIYSDWKACARRFPAARRTHRTGTTNHGQAPGKGNL